MKNKQNYACIASDGTRCESTSFRARKKLVLTIDELNEIKLLKYHNSHDVEDIDNGEKYEWYEIGGGKYGRDMYCVKTKTLRSQTLQEFYGSSTVD